jgi:hypothetical protein
VLYICIIKKLHKTSGKERLVELIRLLVCFRLLAERILTFYLMPWDVNTDDKVRVLLTLYSNVSENAQR